MKNRIHSKFSDIQTQKERLLKSVSSFTNQELNRKPNEDSWSICEVFSHLIFSEDRSVIYINKKIQGAANNNKAGFSQQIKTNLLKFILALPFKYKAPKVVSTFPVFNSLEDIQKEWNNKRIVIEQIINETSEEVLHQQIFKHPSIGKISMLQFLEFLESHIEHHAKQIERIKIVLKNN